MNTLPKEHYSSFVTDITFFVSIAESGQSVLK